MGNTLISRYHHHGSANIHWLFYGVYSMFQILHHGSANAHWLIYGVYSIFQISSPWYRQCPFSLVLRWYWSKLKVSHPLLRTSTNIAIIIRFRNFHHLLSTNASSYRILIINMPLRDDLRPYVSLLHKYMMKNFVLWNVEGVGFFCLFVLFCLFCFFFVFLLLFFFLGGG